MAYRRYRGNLRGSAAQAQRHGGHAHCGENRNTSGLPYHTVCTEPNTVLSLDPNTRVFFFFFFFFFFLAASWNLITRILLPFGNACHYSDIYPILYFESATIIYIYILYLYKYIYNMFVYIYIYRTYSVQMMKCIVITPWPVWLGSVDAPCLFGLLSKPQPVTN